MNSIGNKLGGYALNGVVAVFSATCVFPVIWVAYTSVKTRQEFAQSIVALPEAPTLDQYRTVLLQADFLSYFLNSLFVAAVTLFSVLLFAFLAAYFLSRHTFRGRGLLYSYFVLGIVVPIHAWLLPVFIQFQRLDLLDRRLTLVIPYIAFSLPIAIFLLESYIRTLPYELEESAYIEGAGTFSTLRRIILPLCTPALATVTVLTFNTSWNEFPFALVLIRSQSLRTVPVALSAIGNVFTTNYPQMMAAIFISIMPVLLLYMAFSQKITQGMTAGAVKG